MKLLLATKNRGKVIEIGEALAGLPVQLLDLSTLGTIDAPDETGSTYAENALLKARHFRASSELATLADDSGIVVEALSGELGVQTRRWGAGAHANDAEWIAYFLERMQNESNKRARFICTLAYIDPDGNEHLFEGTCEGTITDTVEAGYHPGLPISACFRPDGFDLVYSAMSIEQKNSTSHRGRALGAFRDFLTERLG